MNEPASLAGVRDAAAEPIDLGTWPHLGYTASVLDRAAERRADAGFMAAAAADPASSAYLISGDRVVLRKAERAGQVAGQGAEQVAGQVAWEAEFDPLFQPSAAARALTDDAPGPAEETVFLGLEGGAPRFGIGISEAAATALKERGDFAVIDLRSIATQGLVAPEHLPQIAEAKAMLHWHARHRFCSACGVPTAAVTGGWKRECPACKAEHFPRTDPVVIMLAVDGERCLLGRQSRFVPGVWSCLAGFVEPGETVEEAARREILEEAGVRCGTVRYFRSQPWPFPMSLMIGCHAEARSTDIVVDRTELEDARWFGRAELAAMLARSHPDGLATPPPVAIAHHIIRAFVEKGADVLR